MVDYGAKEQDVGTRSDRRVDVTQGGSTCETRVHVHQDCTVLRFGLERPAESNRVALGHVRTHNQDCVRIDQVTGKGC